MNDQEKISALAAELERLGKMPSGINADKAVFEESCSRNTVYDPDLVLAALSGVAAEAAAADGGDIYNSGIVHKWCIRDNLLSHEVEGFETYHEALIAALKQIENGKQK